MANVSVALSSETYQMLQSIKSCFQLSQHRKITYDEIIKQYLMEGIAKTEPGIARLFELSLHPEGLNLQPGGMEEEEASMPEKDGDSGETKE